MVKRIGILTYHNNFNRGSLIQAYCLWKSLSEIIPESTVEIIDYRTLSKEIKAIFPENPKIYFKQLNDRNTWKKFFKNHRCLSDKHIITNNHKKAIRFIEQQGYDMVVVGSDQTWRIERGGISFINRPFPNAYYLDPSLDTFKVSYAASANRMSFQSMSESEIKIFKKHISSFQEISVRDTHTIKLLGKMGIHDITRVPDPTFLIDIPSVDLDNLLKSKGIKIDEPILGVDRIESELAKKLINEYRKKGYQIVTPTYFGRENADVNIYNLSPFEYYSLYKYFDLVVTRSFHSTIFSIKNMTPFITLDPIPMKEGDKLFCMLDDLSLLDRYIYILDKGTDEILEQILTKEKPLNKKKVTKQLNEYKNIGQSYIKKLSDELYEKKDQ